MSISTRTRAAHVISAATRSARPALEPLEARRLMSVNVTTYHYDNARDGADTNETALTYADVNKTTFGKVASFPVDGQIYAQPLVMTQVAVPGRGTRDLVLVATEHDTVYAFDAQGNNPAQGYLWKTSLLQTGETTVPQTDYGTNDITKEIGVTGTPVVDPATGILYVVGLFKESNGTYQQRLYALNVSTGANAVAPAAIAASVAGTGYDNVNGVVSFNAFRENQRPALTLANNEVYVGYSAHGDEDPWHGWLLAYNAATLHRDYAYCVTPNAEQGGIWMSGGGPAVDSAGNLYFSTGNGSFDANTGGSDYSMTVEKVSPSLTPLDYFAPYNQSALSNVDLDYGCSSVVLLPTQTGTAPDEAVSVGKWGGIYLNNTDAGRLGGFTVNGPNKDLAEGSIGSRIHNTTSYWNGLVFIGGDGLPVESYAVGNGTLGAAPASRSANTFGNPVVDDGQGAGATVSSNGSTNGIVWAVDNTAYTTGPAVLFAYNASNLGQLLYSSSQAAGGRDTGGNAVKFQDAVVANGYVYVAGANSVTAYGLVTASTGVPTVTAPAAASPTAVTGTTTNLSASATDPAADMHPVYTWAATTVPAGATAPTFTYNGTNAANATAATFYAAGSYTFTVTIVDPNSGNAVTTAVNVTVTQTPTGLALTPPAATLFDGNGLQLTAAAVDQFGRAMATQPALMWSVAPGGAGGTVSAAGLYTAPAAGTGADAVTATAGSLSATATITVAASSATLPIDLTAVDNEVGIVADNMPFTGGLDGGGAALSGILLGTSQTWNGSAFTIPAATAANNVNNAVSDVGQTVPISQNKYSRLKLLATHVNGNAAGLTLTVNYVDGTSQAITQAFSDWYTPQNFPGEGTAVTMPYRDNANGTLDNRTFYVYGYSFAVNSAVAVQSVTLPNDGLLSVLAIDAVGVPASGVPAVTTPAAATPSTVTATTASVTVGAADRAGDAPPTYAWSATNVPAGAAPPAFATAAAATTTVTFYQAGSYTLTVTITDPTSGLTTLGNVAVTVAQTLTAIAVSPSPVTVIDGGTQQFVATAVDQFGQTLSASPAFAWSVAGAGSISSSGLYQAPAAGSGTATVVATAGGVTGSAVVQVSNTASTSFYPVRAGWYRAGVWQGTSGADGGGNYNSPAGTTVLISKNPAGGTLRDAYLLFNVGDAPFAGDTITGVTLTFAAAALNQAGPVGFGVYGVTSTAWGPAAADPSPAPTYPGATLIGTTQNVGGAQGNYVNYTFNLAGAITNATTGLVSLELNSPAATAQETGIEIDNALNTPGVDPVVTVAYALSQPAWLGAGSAATFDAATRVLTVTGPTSIVADPAADEPVINAAGSAAVVTINRVAGRQVHVGGLNLTNGASVVVAAAGPAGAATSHEVLIVGTPGSSTAPALAIDSVSRLDLTDNDLDVVAGSPSAVAGLIARSYAFGAWTGLGGIGSSSAAADPSRLTALGTIQNNAGGAPLFTAAKPFDGTVPGASDVLVRYTYAGDANLDGKVDGSDYSLVDAGYAANAARAGATPGWANGDFNGDGLIDGTDYTLIDNAFNNQAAPIASAAAKVATGAVFDPVAIAPNPTLLRRSNGHALSLTVAVKSPVVPGRPTTPTDGGQSAAQFVSRFKAVKGKPRQVFGEVEISPASARLF